MADQPQLAATPSPAGDYREVRIPTRKLPTATTSGWPPQRSLGCMWHHDDEAVTVLLFPDHADTARALVTLTPDAADCLADELRRCAAWTRDYASGSLSVQAKVANRAAPELPATADDLRHDTRTSDDG